MITTKQVTTLDGVLQKQQISRHIKEIFGIRIIPAEHNLREKHLNNLQKPLLKQQQYLDKFSNK